MSEDAGIEPMTVATLTLTKKITNEQINLVPVKMSCRKSGKGGWRPTLPRMETRTGGRLKRGREAEDPWTEGQKAENLEDLMTEVLLTAVQEAGLRKRTGSQATEIQRWNLTREW